MKKLNYVASPWAAHLSHQLISQRATMLMERKLAQRTMNVVLADDSLVITVNKPDAVTFVFRAAYTPAGDFSLENSKSAGAKEEYMLTSLLGSYRVAIEMAENDDGPLLHYTAYFTPSEDFYLPYWPKDILALNAAGGFGGTDAEIHVEQQGIRSGMIYLSVKNPGTGALLYFQNLTAVNGYCADTGTSVADTVNGQWPEFGFALPAAVDKPMRGGKEYTVTDAFVVYADKAPQDQFEVATQFIDLLAHVYINLPKPPTVYHDYHDIAVKAWRELADHKGCWSHHQGHNYLNAYVCDYKTPPEIMVQLAVLLPLKEYEEWAGDSIPLLAEIEKGLVAFYDEDLGTVHRWLPSAQHQLDGSEEHKKPLIMDSWYLHHPLLNLSRMALHGDAVAGDLLLKSLNYVIKVAHHFDYKWPIFYKMDTLEVIKAEAKPGAGGEKDVAGIYAHLLLQAWEFTGERKYFDEAKRAADSLMEGGFDLFYQANNTAFAAGAMLRLWKETQDNRYLNLGYLLMANIFKNVALWDCRYGYGTHFPLFFAVFPLNDAPYTAVYEEIEVFAAIHDFLAQADDTPLSRSYALLLAEFVRYSLHRMVYYYPTVLPREMLADEVKTGEIDGSLWVPLEDINPGWEKSGEVGQEVYGAGFPFAVVPRHYIKIAGGAYLLFIEYPTAEMTIGSRQAAFKVLGDGRMSCKLYAFKTADSALSGLRITGKREGPLASHEVDSTTCWYEVQGEQQVVIEW